MIRKRRPYSNYYKKRQYFLGGVLGTIGGMVGGPVGSVAGSTIGSIGMNILNKNTDWLGRPKQKPMLPQNRFQGNTASSYGNFAMGGYAPLGPDSIKYIGPKHKDGGILIDEDGMPTDNEQEAIAEVEGGETRDDNYIFSDELKYPGTDLTFAEVHETMVETGASEQDIEELKAIQEEVRESTGIAAKERAGMQDGGSLPDPEKYQFKGGITPELLIRQAFKESRFDPKAVSSKGYRGLAQLGDPAIEDFLKRHPDIESIDPFDPAQAAMVQRWQMNNLYDSSFINKPNQSEGVRLAKTAASYNWGRGNMLNFLNKKKEEGMDIYNSLEWLDYLPEETRDYVLKVVFDENDRFRKELNEALQDVNNQIYKNIYYPSQENEKMYGGTMNKYGKGGKMIKRADGSYSRRGLWDNIRANKGSGKKPTKQMLEQERKIKAAEKMMGGDLPEYRGGGYTVTKSDRKGKTHKVTGPDGSVKHFGDPNLKNRPNNPKAKKSWYARHKKSLDKNPHFRAYARATWAYGGEVPMYRMGGINNPGFRALPEEVQDKIRANMGMGGMIEYANGGGIDNPGFRALPMEVQEKIKANMAMGGELDYMYGGDMPEYKGGGSINIAPEKRGTFKAQATRMGMGVQEAASTILASPKGKYSPAMRRKANFARNFAKKYGGNMEYGYGGKMKYEDGGQLLETGLQYLPEVFTAAKSIFGREKTPEPTQIARTRIPYQDTTFNINPQLQRSSASYRGILADPTMTANQKMAAYSQKLQNEGQLYGQKENIENQRRMQLASQQAQLDAGRRQTQAGLDEQARQERMMNQANYGPFGNIMGAALSSASNKFLQQRGEDRYFDLMNKMYGQNNGDESEEEKTTEPQTGMGSSMVGSLPYYGYEMPTFNFSQSPLLGFMRSGIGSAVNQDSNPTFSVPNETTSQVSTDTNNFNNTINNQNQYFRSRMSDSGLMEWLPEDPRIFVQKYGGKLKMENGGDIGNYMRSMVRKKGRNFLSNKKKEKEKNNVNSNDTFSFSPEEMNMLYSIESGGNPNAVSSAGAIGLGQIMPDTAMSPGFGLPTIFDLADESGVSYKDRSKSSVTELLKNENLNRMFSNLYANKLLEKFGGNRRLALAAYNAGPGAVRNYSGVPPYEETQNYIKKFEEMGLNFND